MSPEPYPGIGVLAATRASVERPHLFGPNAVRSHQVRPFVILAHQFANPIQVLLLAAAGVSVAVGERVNG